MSWMRIHRPPKACRLLLCEHWGVKEHYLYKRSVERYVLTKDGQKLAAIMEEWVKNPDIGYFENVRFIASNALRGENDNEH